VLPVAIWLAEFFHSRITLFHVIERGAPSSIHGEPHLMAAVEADTYLTRIAERLSAPASEVIWHVHTTEVGDVARSIVTHAEELGCDLILLCTHGRGGLRDLLFGSIAQQVLQRGTMSVLLVQPKETAAPTSFMCRKLLVPLDGNPDHEAAIPVATELAHACDAAIHVLVVVPTLTTLSGDRAATAMLMPTGMQVALDLAQQGAADYLRCVAGQVAMEGASTTAEVVRGEPASAVVGVAERVGADLIVMATHGRAGMEAFWSGSLAAKVIGRYGGPLLLVKVKEL
jgi:nucleotide-binding universal stress UspA family protein